MQIGVDLMGSDQTPQAIFEAVSAVAEELPAGYGLSVFVHNSLTSSLPETKGPIEIIEVEEAIEMGESPLRAVRRKKNSSMAVAMRLLKEGKLDAFLSTGNTGALIANAMFHLPMLPEIERPALLIMLPTGKRGTAVLDVGANITFKPHHLVDYAQMGVIYRQCVDGMESPLVGLLNIGVEEEKGTKEMKEGYQILHDFCEKVGIPFIGNIEGREVCQGKVDLLVTDGFTGNVFLKTCEGVFAFFLDYLKKSFLHEPSAEIREILGRLHHQFDYTEHPGAVLCGVEGLVIKCHGNSDRTALINGIHGAMRLCEKQLILKMKDGLSRLANKPIAPHSS